MDEYNDHEYDKALKEYHRGKRAAMDANNNDNEDNADFLLDAEDDAAIKKIKDKIYKSFDDKKYVNYWMTVRGYSRTKVFKEIIHKTSCGRCRDCTKPSCFKASLITKWGTISKYVADRHYDRLHNHVYVWAL